jgi:two-component system phosphate regulon sensor histidine kinase PhoR
LARANKAFRVSVEERQELEAMLDSMQDAVVAVDAEGRIQWTNQRMQRLVPGASFSNAVRIGHALVQTIRDPEVLECVRTALQERQVCERRSTSLFPGRIFEVSAAPMPGGGAVAVLHDITRLEQMERTQRDFVANVSHELRTPLTSITGYVETLLDHEASLSVQAREFLSTILKNATRMNRLTEELLVMARVEASEQTLNPVPVRADVLVRDAVQAMSGLVQDTEAALEIGAMTDCRVLADTDAVLQVLSNLIENAIKYGRGKNASHARVVVSAREVEEPGLAGAVEFSVRDYGQGIASEHLNRIFERFYRVDKARSRESGGTGLGLAIAQHMVQAQGGRIRAESELNAGSNFVFTLPAYLGR